MRAAHVIALVLIACPCGAAWTGFPLASNTNLDWWYDIEALNIVSQYMAAVAERYIAINYTRPDIVDQYYLPAGTNVVVGTNGTWVYTNVELIVTNVYVTNAFGPFEYQYNDFSGAHTATAYVYMSHSRLTLGPESPISYPYRIREWLFTEAGTPGNLAQYMLCTNHAVGGSFDTYLATTNGLGDYPFVLPTMTKASWIYQSKRGYTTNEVQNGWGHVTNAYAAYGNYVDYSAEWPLAEAVYASGSWTQNWTGYGPRSQFISSNSVRPYVQYLSGGDVALTGITVTIAGAALNISASTNQSATQAVETVVLATTNRTTLSLPWWGITNMQTASAPPNTNDMLVAAWTNVGAIYDQGATATWHTVWSQIQPLDDLQSAINAMMWTRKLESVTWSAQGENNSYIWTGESIESWEAAKTACEGAAPIVSSRDAAPEHGTTGEKDGATWRARAFAQYAYPSVGNMATSVEHAVDVYARTTNYNGKTWDAQDDSVLQYYWRTDTIAQSTNGTVIGAALGTTDFPPNWCADPAGGDTALGWQALNPEVAIKWDFSYK